MGYYSSNGVCIFVCALFLGAVVVRGDPVVPALMIFGDSVVDAGNNNHLTTIVKANFPPYGRDFVTHRPTGRFCNGKLATDFTAEYLGFTSYPPPYLSNEAKGDILLTGANFASGASGYYDGTARLYTSLSLPRQVQYYREYQRKVVALVGNTNASAIFSGGINLLSAGTSDFVQNYYINPVLNRFMGVDRFSDILAQSFSTFVQNMYAAGARRIGVTNVPPMGCLPGVITLFGRGRSRNQCIPKINQDAVTFNTKLNNTAQTLKQKYPDLKLVVFDIYQPLLELVNKPSDNGFSESRKACCGTGMVETAVLCNARSVGTCSNATTYVFWDGFHPSEAANQILAGDLLAQGFDLIS